ncbi:isoleucine--tRNA ligase [Sporolactobacillus laevolacticus]|uniref:Isoleucine--tRNA ligase n=1 Tax=Sporolactobacillus laevolacticus DSM 442 TaxID=1395513 RepID=V6J8L3_9BACL|nr:isoleucine--tRNA ligase [Sporolactobacillus laevolacticus]EST13129.1 isoleucyl-tRNA synthetase [Sporolactobacillus laevolacticus DSM 442]
MDYKKTLLMPKTDFKMRGSLPNKEPHMQEQWDQDHIYEQSLKANEGKPTFILHDGPPYANGNIHIGHAENKVLKDIINRFKSMSGYQVPYVPGWDTHGLPIEQQLAKQGIDRKKMSVADLREKCKEYALGQVEHQKKQFKRLGVRGDWDHPYLTLHKEYEAEQIEVFGEMAKKGYIYKDKKTVYWSPSSESALAEAEIEYKDVKSYSIYVAFHVTDGKDVLNPDEEVVIWTTTPWTMPANLAIAVNSKFDYSVVQVGDRKFVVAADLVESLTKTLGWEDPQVLRTFNGKSLEHVVCRHPFYNRPSVVILGDHVTLDAGTGCVHTAPGFGADDFYVGKKYGLDILCPVDDRGCMTDEAPGFEGLFYEKANEPVIKKLEEEHALLKAGTFTHSYPHDWRTKKPVIWRATKQWFASIKAFRDDILNAIHEVRWIPSWGDVRMTNMIKDREDWCISRQRAWGVPIPVFYGEDGEPIITDETIQHVADLFRKHGSNIWFQWEAKELLPEGFTSEHSPNGVFRKETDIMDVWFDSGSSHQGVLTTREGLRRPADLYLEGSDQYRGWFNSSLATSVAVTGHAPYKQVLSHGFTLDGKGLKMSKSVGNVIDPMKVMQQYGADIIRLWVASVDYQADARVSNEILGQVAEVYRKIRNTVRFMLGNLNDFTLDNAVPTENMPELEQYMMVKLNQFIDTCLNGYNDYQFLNVYKALQNYCSLDLSAFYMDIAKDALYVQPKDSLVRRSAQTVLYKTVIALTKILSPIIPHTAEEIWQHIPGTEQISTYVQLTDMPELEQVSDSEQIEKKWAALITVRDDVLKSLEKARDAKLIGKSLEASVTLYVTAETAFLKNTQDLDKLLIVSQVTVAEGNDVPEAADQYTNIAVAVAQAEGEKCERCWAVLPSVGEDTEHPKLCAHCAETVRHDYADMQLD